MTVITVTVSCQLEIVDCCQERRVHESDYLRYPNKVPLDAQPLFGLPLMQGRLTIMERVSSTLEKSTGKKNLIDGSPETCWTSTQVSFPYIRRRSRCI